MPAFVGRDDQLDVLRAHHAEAAAGRPQTVLLEGVAGVGKTSLLHAFLATVDPASVVAASGDEGERLFRFGVVEQLLGRHDDWVDAFAAGADLLRSLDERVGSEPVVLVVDDAHLADSESMVALTFMLRRLRADRVMAVITTRSDETGGLPAGLLKLSAQQDGRVRLEGMREDEIIWLAESLGHGRLSSRSARRLQRHTAGNALYLSALLAELSRDVLEADGPLPAPESYAALVVGAITQRSDHARQLVRAASVLADGSVLGEVAAVAGIADPEAALEELRTANLLTCTHDGASWRVGFPHPLLRASVYDDLGPVERRRLHSRAATVVGGAQGLVHRVAATDGVDPALARDLAVRAGELKDGGDLIAAADLYAKAGRVAGGPDGTRWLIEAAGVLLVAGLVASAKGVEESIEPGSGGASRAHLRAKIAWFGGDPGLAIDLATSAWEHADELDERGRGEVAAILSQLHNMQGDGVAAASWAERALAADLPLDLADSTAAARVMGLLLAGEPARAREALGSIPDSPDGIGPGRLHQLTVRGALRAAADDLEGARRDLEAVRRNSPSELAPQRLLGMGVLAEVDYRLGRWDSSIGNADQALSLAEDGDQRWVQGYLHVAAVLVCAGRGWWSDADDHLARGRALAEELEDPATWAACANVAAHLATCRGEPEQVIKECELLRLVSIGILEEPGWLHWPVQNVSALVQTGRFEDAEAELARLGRSAAERGSRSRLAGLARVEGELATALRDHTRARRAFVTALELGGAADALEQGLIRASYGRFLRRRGERRAARMQLEEAIVRFRALGAAPFIEACQEELVACGGTASVAPASLTDGLTPQERVIAGLVRQGLTNREIAQQLVLSVKTISYHLGNVYTKLDVHSRTQLLSKLGAAPD
jgi:ATP/maltotriose-dependent transcriptional regulator MalT